MIIIKITSGDDHLTILPVTMLKDNMIKRGIAINDFHFISIHKLIQNEVGLEKNILNKNGR